MEAQVIIGIPLTIHKWIVDDMKMLLIDDVDRVLVEAVGSTISNDVVEVFVSKTKQVLRTMEVPSLDNVKQYKVGQTIICVHTKESVGMLCEAPEDNKFMLKTIDVVYTQEQRDKILKEFEEKRFQVLISTEILD
ncbi:DEAD-box ATP-dependent RNA helicase 38 [Tanacetum coccineum]